MSKMMGRTMTRQPKRRVTNTIPTVMNLELNRRTTMTLIRMMVVAKTNMKKITY